jgi:hypothetical protein
MSRPQRLLIPPTVCSILLLISPSLLHADGGTVRLSERAGTCQVTVFTSPTPFRAGPVDISVLLQDAASGLAVTDARVTVRLTSRTTGRVLEFPATTEAATNKLLRAAVFELPKPGWWDVDVLIEAPSGGETVRLSIEASEPIPHWLTLWPWFSWPFLVVAVFGIHRKLVQLKLRQATQQRAGGPGTTVTVQDRHVSH